MARVEIRGEQHSVGELFSERYAFSIPPYQRTYAWGVEQAGELLDDVLGYLGDGSEPVEDLSPYFLGSIVLIKQERPDAQVVDGQQRLITVTILLAVLRALIPAEFAESITRRLYEPADPLNNIPPRYRLRPKERDAIFFQQYIQSEGGIERLRSQLHPDLSESQRNMHGNAMLYVNRLDELPAERRVRLAQYLVQRCLVIVVTTPDLDAAYRIFSVLNNRGLDLTVADLLKAEVIGKIPPAVQQEYTERWELLEEQLGSDEFSEYFSQLRAMYVKPSDRGTIYHDVRTRVFPVATDAQHLVDEILIPHGNAFYILKSGTYEHEDIACAEKINGHLRWLRQLDNTDWMAPAIRYLALYHSSPERLELFFRQLERLAASLMIRRQYAHRRQPRYAQLLAAIDRREDLRNPKSPIQLSQQECEETLTAISGDLYLMPPTPRNYILRRLDSYLAGTGAIYDQRIMTVEHVLPRTPRRESEWMKWFPTEQLRARWVHRLANLVLLTREKNRDALNYDFATKKRKYFVAKNGVSPFALTTQVLAESEWTPEVLERRQQQLLGHVREMWRL